MTDARRKRDVSFEDHRFLGEAILPGVALFVLLAPPMAVGAERAWFPVLDNQSAWELLPKTKSGLRGEALPVWARVLARTLPSTTAAMLELDRVFRTENPLPPQLRAKIRWVAARTVGSSYSEACARADLVRAGGSPDDLQTIVSAPHQVSDKERRVFDFSRRLCEAAYEVTDAEVSALVADWGAKDLCAIVLTLAYANFQDRLLISLGIESETAEPLPPLDVAFDWEELKKSPLEDSNRDLPLPPPGADPVPIRVTDSEWLASSPEELHERMKNQQLRAPRIPIPPDDEVERQIPPGLYPPGMAATIRWNSIGYGYQPRLTDAWFFAMRRFRDESQLPGDFRQSVFWIVTRSNWCFY